MISEVSHRMPVPRQPSGERGLAVRHGERLDVARADLLLR
jgi:hypothetical protein